MKRTHAQLLSRRFVRASALQHSYAFAIAQQANQDWARQVLQQSLVPDVLAEAPPTPTQQAQDEVQAQTLFSSMLDNSQPADMLLTTAKNARVRTAVTQAYTVYEHAMAQDRLRLQQGWSQIVQQIDQACTQLLQLLVEWATIAQKQVARPRLHQDGLFTPSVGLHQCALLQQLQADQVWSNHVQALGSDWESHYDLVEDWYHQFIKKDPQVAKYLTAAADAQLMIYLVEHVIGKQAVTQAFFSTRYLHWFMYKHVVKKRIRSFCNHLLQDLEKGTKLLTEGVAAGDTSLQRFYEALVMTVQEHNTAIEAMVAEKVQHWTTERLVPLDKIMVKLALCEMLYFKDIPVKVTLNEYIDLSKIYSTSKSSQFVNGLLDAVASTVL